MKRFTIATTLLLLIQLSIGVTTNQVFASEKDAVTVANLAELREQAADGTTVYQVTGEIILTHQHGQRNQKYFQDATAAILIDDNGGIITSSYNLYDGVTGISGTLTTFNQLLQFVPTADPGAATSTDNEISIPLVTLAEISPVHQAQLIRVNSVDFTGDQTTFSGSTSYTISDGSIETFTFRTPSNSAALDYFGSPVPQAATDMFLLVSQFNETMQVFARSLSDFYPDGLPSYDVTFNVIDEDDNVISDAKITFDSETLPTGTYLIEEVPAGTYTYTVERAGYFTRSAQMSVTEDVTVTIVLVEIDANAINAFPWVEGFEGESFPPANWSSVALGAGGWASTATANSGTKAAWHTFATADEAESWLITPQIDISAEDNVLMKFFQRNGFMGDYGLSAVMISQGSGNPEHGEFVQVYESSATVAAYTERIVSLGDYAGKTIYIAFLYEGQNAHQWYIDDVKIEQAPEAILLNNLAELQDQEIGGDLVFQINGEVVITHMHGQRNQKYVQDASGAVLIDDAAGIIETTYNLGDAITGLKGTLGAYFNLLQIVPTDDPGAATSTGNVVTPLQVTFSELTPAHQSMLVVVAGVAFDTDLTTLEPSTNYTVTDGTAIVTLRPPSNSAALDYFGTGIPTQPVNMILLVSQFNDAMQVFPRSLADIDVQLSNENNIADPMAVAFPNPFTDRLSLNGIEVQSTVEIFNSMGQRVDLLEGISGSVTLQTENYNSGVYFVKIINAKGMQQTLKVLKN